LHVSPFSVALLALLSSTSLARAELPETPVVDRPLEHELEWAPPVLHATSLFMVMRATETVLWPDPFANFDPDFVGARYEDAYTLPPKFDATRSAFEWDGDHWTINVLGHGLLGSELYLRARTCHFGWAGSLGFTAAASAVWEYGFEANGVRPSAQDLIYTPLAGLVLGEARFRAARALEGQGGFAGVLRVALDPFGEAERALGSPC
jgi:hypothetical protein